jgi:hypothetical protein
MAVVIGVYAVIAAHQRWDVFTSPDQGGKMLQVLALLEGRYDLSISYPGRWLDPGLAFRPYMISYVTNGRIQMPWPMAWALPSAALFSIMGGPGLLVLPVAGGALAALGAGRLAERITAGSGWLAIVLTGLATPMLTFSTLFWEHAPAAGLFMAGLALGWAGRPRSRARPLLAGCCFGLAIAWRNEVALYFAAWAAADCWVFGRRCSRQPLAWMAAGLGLVLLPTGTYNWFVGRAVISRSIPLTPSVHHIVQRALGGAAQLPTDFLVGQQGLAPEMPEALRWAPAVGLVLLAAAHLLRGRWQRLLRVGGLLLAGSATAALVAIPAPQAIQGFLIAAPFLATILLVPRELTAGQAGRALALFAAVVLPVYVLTASIALVRGVTTGAAEWGPRYLLPLYAPLSALAAASLYRLPHQRQRPEASVGALLVVLGLLFQLASLARLDLTLRQLREDARLIESLPSGLVVIRPPFLVQMAPPLAEQRAVFCTETPAALKNWADLALRAGEQEFWYVDFDSLPTSWLLPGSATPTRLGEVSSGALQAVRYDAETVRAALRSEGPDRDTCGYRVNT